jgi:chemotaxis family two-component system sensor kinase Cph1
MLEQLGPGDHAALFYRNRAEQFAIAIPYIEIGLSRNERCLYIAGDNSVAMILEAMDAYGIDVDRAQSEGRLTIATPDQTYLRHGVFEPAGMLQGLQQEIQLSLQQGYAAFRAAGELGWAASLPSALLRLYEYEMMVDADLHPLFAALCQYSENLFREDILAQMLSVHPKIIARGRLFDNPHYVPPGQANHPYFPPTTLDAFATTAPACA